jgi:hypothetical protein
VGLPGAEVIASAGKSLGAEVVAFAGEPLGVEVVAAAGEPSVQRWPQLLAGRRCRGGRRRW